MSKLAQYSHDDVLSMDINDAIDDWTPYDGAIRALAEKDARIAELERALREIVEHEPTVEDHDPTEWGEGPCAECVDAAEAKWPPSGMCAKHYNLVSRLQATNERHRSYQYLDMRRIARAALAPAHPTPAESAKCEKCGGRGFTVAAYDHSPPERVPCPNGCAERTVTFVCKGCGSVLSEEGETHRCGR